MANIYRTLGPDLLATWNWAETETVPMNSELVGSRVAVIVTALRVDGLYEHVTTTSALATLFLHPGKTFPLTLNVIFPATVEVSEIIVACRYTKIPVGSERVAVDVPLYFKTIIADPYAVESVVAVERST